MKKLLLTGFEPFGGESINPALEAVRCLPDEIGGAQIIKLQIPVVYQQAAQIVCEAMQHERPDAVICVGQAGGRDAVTPERVAINVMDASVPDNAGIVMTDQPVDPAGPAAYFSTLPLREMVENVKAQGISCRISNTAGTYVCNNVMYAALHHAALHMPATKAGFIHVPYIPQQTANKENMPAMPLEDITRALEAAVAAVATSL